MKSLLFVAVVQFGLISSSRVHATDTVVNSIIVDVRDKTRPISPYMTGACIEDLNHEIYGGLYSQMIFGESFLENWPSQEIKNFTSFGDGWTLEREELCSNLVGRAELVYAFGRDPIEFGVQVKLPKGWQNGTAGLIFNLNNSKWMPGGYEVDFTENCVRLLKMGRLLKEFPTVNPTEQWISVIIKERNGAFEILMDGQPLGQFTDADGPLQPGGVGVMAQNIGVRFRHFTTTHEGRADEIPFLPITGTPPHVSKMWSPVQAGTANGSFDLLDGGYLAHRSQRVTLTNGDGEWGVRNQGVNHAGMNWVAGKTYEGVLRIRSTQPTSFTIKAQSRDGSKTYASVKLSITKPKEWEKICYSLTPSGSDPDGSFSIVLNQQGSLDLGYVFLQPGDWGRYKGLPVRRDVVEALLDEGITAIRYGGSMISSGDYRWKKMLGPRDERVTQSGFWYGDNTHGWGIIDLINLGEATGILCVPAFNMNETPQDMGDFVEYANGAVATPWGARRAADGHPEPYRLACIELGNEERINESYYEKFRRLAEAMWSKDPRLILTVGEWNYRQIITDPYHIKGADSGITTLAPHAEIMALAKKYDAEVWFDYHIETHTPTIEPHLKALPSYVQAIDHLSNGAKHKVVVFEFNAGQKTLERGLSNAVAINTLERLGGKVPVACVANGLEVSGEAEAYDQGMIFINPSQVWSQPQGYVTRMLSRNYEPLLADCDVRGALNAGASQSKDGKTVVLKVVNPATETVSAEIKLNGFTPSGQKVEADVISGSPQAVNPEEDQQRVIPLHQQVELPMTQGRGTFRFAPSSLTILKFSGEAGPSQPAMEGTRAN